MEANTENIIKLIIICSFGALLIGIALALMIYHFTKPNKRNWLTRATILPIYRNNLVKATLINIRERSHESELLARYYRRMVYSYSK